jgi:L,D-peptidoglycan transpeptidase YkuD (ErfK/YbiS/YcfS/YnhG family)
MLIQLKNKDTLIYDDFKFQCSIGKNGTKKHKIEGDKATPKGIFSLGRLYYRKDRLNKPITKKNVEFIKKNDGWCDDPNHNLYNKKINIDGKIKHEKLFRYDILYDCFIVINYNTKKITPHKGSAIFIHLTEDYKATKGCIALKKKDFLILAKLINKNTKIKI